MIRPKFAVALCTLTLLSLPKFAAADQTLQEALADPNAPAIIRVEEDWEFFSAEPYPSGDLPQVVTVFGPTDASFGTHCMLEINHGTLPSFQQGGMQLQVWWGDYLIGYKNQHAPNELTATNETVTYTTVTELKSGFLEMAVENGNSQSWGSFGGTGTLSVKLATSRTDLNPYDPSNSIRHSRVTFGANRVHRLVRREIRFYSATGEYVRSEDDVYVHELAINQE